MASRTLFANLKPYLVLFPLLMSMTLKELLIIKEIHEFLIRVKKN